MAHVVAQFVGSKREFLQYLKKMHETARKLALKADAAASKGEWHVYDRHMDAAVQMAQKANKLKITCNKLVLQIVRGTLGKQCASRLKKKMRCGIHNAKKKSLRLSRSLYRHRSGATRDGTGLGWGC